MNSSSPLPANPDQPSKMTLQKAEELIRGARLRLEPQPLPLSQWATSADGALERLKQWHEENSPIVVAWLNSFEAGLPLPELTPEESTQIALRLDAALDALEVICHWERVRAGLDPADPVEPAISRPDLVLRLLLDELWHHFGFGKTADMLDSLADAEWPRSDKFDMN